MSHAQAMCMQACYSDACTRAHIKRKYLPELIAERKAFLRMPGVARHMKPILHEMRQVIIATARKLKEYEA
ncbi:hypothetical protein [Chitinilyticum aquatile]|uniref:hypothetical protein n=1 Tax=Chitinilyticum aquatile TaxID=362520 RepID=UPI00041F99BE|nr:hypothetical protein [Chitinilyticum aquatile]